MAVSTIRDRRAETTAVRRALAAAGIPAVVEHGRGTAWGWLEVNVGNGEQAGPHAGGTDQGADCPPACRRCAWLRDTPERAERIIIDVTGRSGGYNDGGDIIVRMQDAWCQRCGVSYPVSTGHRHSTPAPDGQKGATS